MVDMENNMRDLDLLYEIGTMRHIRRTWAQFGGINFANLAEHTFRVIWIAVVLSQMEKANIERVILLALIHDLPETRTGDVNYLSRVYTKRDELAAIDETTKETSIQHIIASAWEEYESRQTLESKVVKDADTLDCDLELREQRCNGCLLEDTFSTLRQIASEKLYTQSARNLFLSIRDSDPHEWHTKTKNRLTAGDWNKGAA